MQDVTDLRFMSAIANDGSPITFYWVFSRLHHSGLDKNILSSIIENSTGRPIFAQLIGESIPDPVRTRELSHYPVASIDLNMGWPQEFTVGGGLLRDPEKINLGELRGSVDGLLTVVNWLWKYS